MGPRTVTLTESAATALNVGSSKHIPALDGVRGLAILAVFFHHYGAGGIHSTSAVVRGIATVCGLGWSGVDLFFVLSGFLITGILFDTQREPGYYRKFYARRTLRIFPIYYGFAAITLVIVPFGVWQKGHLFFLVYLGYPAAVIWPALVNLPIRITHLWSLTVEEQFYMLWPWMIRKFHTSTNILDLCVAVGVGSLVARVVFPGWAYASLPCRMDGLALGAALAILFRGDLWQRCQRSAWALFLASAGTVVLMCVLRHTTDHNDPVIRTVGFSVIAIAYGALLVLSLGPLTGLFSLRILRIFGKYSYGIYLYHFPLTTLFEHAKPFFTRYPLGSLSYVATSLAANLAIAALSFHLFEQPILKLKSCFEYRNRAETNAPARRSRKADVKMDILEASQ
jgi:peptidoglycan/LPS O-acetylase OafA/YrhL